MCFILIFIPRVEQDPVIYLQVSLAPIYSHIPQYFDSFVIWNIDSYRSYIMLLFITSSLDVESTQPCVYNVHIIIIYI